ncbi:MAG: ATP-binding cassette domain-containing protein, partial [Duodenibacillus sp.]|nr:ATP-binding cassette domain-containing protein [Duodenibacillus sp.]
EGELIVQDGLRAVYLEQEPALDLSLTLRDSLVARGRLEAIDDERDRWERLAKLDEYLDRLSLDGSALAQTASGGERKKAALALALSLEPDLLLLDEPTNHLDVDSILQLESILKSEYRSGRSLMVITHDRAFLDSVVSRILELDRGILRSYPGNFAAYEARKGEELAAEELERRRFDKFWAQEEVWIRKGIEARRTRNEGRVRRLEALRRERAARRERLGRMNLVIDAGERSGKVVVEATGLTKSFGERVIVKDLDFMIMRGDKLGLVGHNGTGKSTLIRLLLGEIAPDKGRVKLGTNLRIAYFDQLRAQLDDAKTVADTVSQGSEWVEVGGQKKHVMSYLSDFLFSPRRASVPVGNLSGGERNRLLLARLFSLPANLLVLDEPTNDLDIESLELLESTLESYPGTVILVSHDRRFLDDVVTDILAPVNWQHPDGRWMRFVGGYEDWERQRAPAEEPEKQKSEQKAAAAKSAPRKAAPPQRIRMSFKETRELAELPDKIESLEAESEALLAAMSSPDYHKRSIEEQKADKERSAQLPSLIESLYRRWEELSEKQSLAEAL